jgi:hypothetical protein
VSTAVACGAALVLAVALFVRERRLWRARTDLDGPVFRYSRARFVRRGVGCAALAAVAVLAFLGLEVLDFTGNLIALQAYWACVAVLCLALLVVPVLDLRETYRHIVRDETPEALRREAERLRRDGEDRRP